MSQLNQPPNEEGYQLRSMVAKPLPAEVIYPLSEDEFETLRDGATSDAKSGLCLFIGLFVSGLIGIFSLYENLDWNHFWASQRMMPLLYFGVLVLVAGGSFVGGCICGYRLFKEDTTCSRLQKRIENHFQPAMPSPVVAPDAEPPPANVASV